MKPKYLLIGAVAFLCCFNLYNTEFTAGLTLIGIGMFQFDMLYSVTIPASVTYIGERLIIFFMEY